MRFYVNPRVCRIKNKEVLVHIWDKRQTDHTHTPRPELMVT